MNKKIINKNSQKLINKISPIIINNCPIINQ